VSEAAYQRLSGFHAGLRQVPDFVIGVTTILRNDTRE
jgi:hypothetical protein